MTTTQARTALLEAARAFRPRILAERDRIEEGRRIPDDLAKELARTGFFRMWLPAAYGGLDLDPMEGLEVVEELARADAAVGWCVVNCTVNWTTARLAEDAAREIFADPDTIVANSTRPGGTAVVVDGSYWVSGRWSLVSGCQISDWIQLQCIVHEDGAPRMTPDGTPENRFMHCPTAGCEIIDTWTVSGLRGTGSHDVAVRDLFVPARYASWRTDPLVLSDQRYRFPTTMRALAGLLGAVALGIGRGAIETLVELAAEKKEHERSANALREDRGAQSRIAQADALMRSARLYLYDAVSSLWDEVLATGEASIAGRAQVMLASWHAVNSAVQAVDMVYLTGGATSLYASCPLERAFRDVHAVTQHIGAHPRNLEAVGRVLFGLEPNSPMLTA